MPASPARVLANQQNALRSTGPKTEEGKARSRANAVKHGLTGDGVALPAEDAAEVARLENSFAAELKPSGDVGRTLVRRMALMAVRMDRCVDQEDASLAARVRQAEADFDAEWPESEGEDDPDREPRRAEAARRALFDPSKEACLARKYEAAAERCFFRSLKELRQVERAAKGPEVGEMRAALGSFLPADKLIQAMTPKPQPMAPKPADRPSNPRPTASSIGLDDLFSPVTGVFELPIAIGRPR